MKVKTDTDALKRRIRVARGEEPCDVLFVNGKIVSTFTAEVLECPVAVAEGRVCALGGEQRQALEVVDLEGAFLSPSFIDPHIHVESSMLTPEGFAEAVVPHGTGATVSDPHEIVNVFGMAGYAYMRNAARDLPMDIFFSIPSCVPATHLETAGAALSAGSVGDALDSYPDAPALSEMMNFPGVIYGVDDVIGKVAAARDRGFPVDGHSPGLAGNDLDAYLNALIMTDHECMTPEEAREKLRRGMWVFMREGSAARNLADLASVVDAGTLGRLCIASDDRHPDDLITEGHMDNALRIAVGAGVDPLWALRMVTLNPAQVYGFKDRGGIAPGYRADLAILEDLERFGVRAVYRAGKRVAENGRLMKAVPRKPADGMLSSVCLPDDLDEKMDAYPSTGRVRVIGVEPAQITTRNETGDASDAGAGRPLQFLAVVERHRGTGNVGLGFARGFELAAGAFASTVSHDSHNLVLVGATPADMAHAARTVEAMGGGFAVVRGGEVLARLPLPVAGLMSLGDASETASALKAIHDAARSCGCSLPAPFMTLAFLALPVIPSLKLTDKGLVDVDRFELVPLAL